MAVRDSKRELEWQSRAILLVVVPWTAVDALLSCRWWTLHQPSVAWTTLGVSVIFGLIVWLLRAGTLAAAATGTAITASLVFASTQYPYANSWLHGLLLPLLAVFLLTFAATRLGKAKKEKLGTGESRRGRNAAQVAANLGIAALSMPLAAGAAQILDTHLPFEKDLSVFFVAVAAALAALAEAAADTVSSEIGQVLGGTPRMLTTFRRVEPGTDGGVSLAGTLAGVLAAAIVAAVGSQLILGGWSLAVLTIPAAVFGLLVDSLLGATLERRGLLNNDAVNFLSTLSASLLVIVESRILFGHLSS